MRASLCEFFLPFDPSLQIKSQVENREFLNLQGHSASAGDNWPKVKCPSREFHQEGIQPFLSGVFEPVNSTKNGIFQFSVESFD